MQIVETYLYQYLALAVFLFIPVLNIHRRAGVSMWFSLLLFLPLYGLLICSLILAKAEWSRERQQVLAAGAEQ